MEPQDSRILTGDELGVNAHSFDGRSWRGNGSRRNMDPHTNDKGVNYNER